MSVAKNRFHRGLTSALRQRSRREGLSLDEETAQFALAGLPVSVAGAAQSVLADIISSVLNRRDTLIRAWEAAHPGKNPYPPSFPDRVAHIARAALNDVYETQNPDASLQLAALLGALDKIVQMGEAELQLDPFTVEDSIPRTDEE